MKEALIMNDVILGSRRLVNDIEQVCGFKLNIHWYITWNFITPVVLFVSILFLVFFLIYKPRANI